MNQTGQSAKTILSEHITLASVLRGLLISYLITIPTFIIFALILTYTSFPEMLISPAVVITTMISILTAGSTSTRGVKNKGWLNGGIVGMIYMLVLYLASSLVFNDFTVDNYVITMGLIGIFTGAIGGIIGINIKRPSHAKDRRSR
jgi:putative membrane protein (TIGR04086 family)